MKTRARLERRLYTTHVYYSLHKFEEGFAYFPVREIRLAWQGAAAVINVMRFAVRFNA